MQDDWTPLPPMTGEPRQHGGYAVYEMYGTEYMAEIGASGGEQTLARYGVEHMREIGRKGGDAKFAKYGRAALVEMGRKGHAVQLERGKTPRRYRSRKRHWR